MCKPMFFIRMSDKQLSRNIFFYFLFPIVFTIGFILGTLYSSSSVIETDNRPSKHPDYSVLQQKLSYLVVLIFSSPATPEKRQVIRKTWLLTKGNFSIRHYFVLGAGSLSGDKLAALRNEHSLHGDLLLLQNFNDSYFRLSEKLREVFKWIDKNIQFKFILKVDDDTFVRLDALFNELTKLPEEKLYWGFFDGIASVKRTGKWKESEWFLCDRYLPYALGGGYVLSRDLVRLIVSVSDKLSLYQNEDVSLGTWLAPFNITRMHSPNFDTEYLSRGCFNSYLVTHKQTNSMMKRKYKSLVNTGKICIREYRDRSSYVYNWNVLPSQCCSRTDDVP